MRNGFLLSIILLTLTFFCKAQPVTITPPFANIEPGGSVTLTASGALYYRWSPATGLSTTEGPVTVASPVVTTTYTCSGYAPGAESVVNGDFNQGNVGFTSAYQYNSNLWNEGTYYVDYDASLHHESFHGLGHGGTGNFMMVNGATTPGTNVWTEQITVHPNTYYAFSTWVCTLAGQAHEVALLQFSINGTQIGNVFSAPPYTNEWRQFYELWYSDNSTSATITILNQNTVGSGNDFGLDDISFCELVLVGAPECTVYVGSMSATATADDAELCKGGSTTLHALPVNGSGDYTFSWSPANTLDNPTSQHPVATPSVGTTTYTCLVEDVGWNNTAEVSVGVTVYPTYDETAIDTVICFSESYTFHAQDHNVTYTQSVDTSFTLHTIHGCDSIVSLSLTVWPENVTDTLPPVSRCAADLPYVFEGVSIYDPDTYTFTLQDNHGCPKPVQFEFSVTPYSTIDITKYVGYYTDSVYHCYIPEVDTIITYHSGGTHIDTLPTAPCESIFTLNLTFCQIPDTTHIYDTVCDSYEWDVNGETYDHSCDTLYSIPLYFDPDDPNTQVMYYDSNNPSAPPVPCTKDYMLHLIVNHEIVGEPVTIDCDTPEYENVCNSYPYPDPYLGLIPFENDIDTLLQGLTGDSCHYSVNFRLMNLKYIPVPDTIRPDLASTPCFSLPEDPNEPDTAMCAAVVTNTEFFSFQYDFYVEESGNSVWDTCIWSISKLSWQIEPRFGADHKSSSCTVYVADRDEGYVKLTATAINHCGETKRTFYLKSSFLDIGEQQATPSDFSIVPNPNNGQMKLVFDHFAGKVDVKVYDMMGHLIDSFETNADMESKAVDYNLMGHKGIFFFVANGREGTVAKKVVIDR